ncbi:MAG TPA: class I SAM-dependent methyltransferase [Bacteroidales bacterium]|nr:class I SAM-dependent methyltransferase [Bacteroidales bacterium]
MNQPINFNLVADLYDSYVTVSLDIPFFIEETSSFDDEILELMCGTGRVSLPLLEWGRKLCCIDYSEKMLDVFRSKIKDTNYPVRLINMDVTKLDLNKKFGLIVLPFHSLSEILSDDLQYKALQCISKHLKPDGIFICTLQNPVARLKTADGMTRKIGEFKMDENKNLLVSCSYKYNPDTRIVSGFQLYEIYDDSGNLIEKRTLDINFKPITYSDFKNMIIPLDLEIIQIYGDYSKNTFLEDTSEFMILKLKLK